MRENLGAVNGKRMRFTAIVERFGSKSNWHGYPDTTILLRDVRFIDTGELACDHLWFKQGAWALGLVEGHKFAFDARVDSYAKGYQGGKAEKLGVSSYSVDYHLERPTKVEILDEEEKSSPTLNSGGRRGAGRRFHPPDQLRQKHAGFTR